MRVNLISVHRKFTGISQDVNIIRGLLYSIYKDDLVMNMVQYIQPECNEADVNIFFEVINPSLFSYASKNIWIPNIESTYKTWTPYLHMMNEIWAKTHEAEEILKSLTPTHVRYIGWTSLNKITPKKNYFQAIVPIGRNLFREYTVLFLAYSRIKRTDPTLYSRLPILNVLTWYNIEVPSDIDDHVVLHNKQLSDTEYDNILADCGVCICLSEAEGFGHAVNESMASGCNLILSDIAPFRELAGTSANYCIPRCTETIPERYGNRISTDVTSLCEVLEEFVDKSHTYKKNCSEVVRSKYEQRHKEWIENMSELIPKVFMVEPSELPKEEELPDVSIICITKDRRIFMPILKYSYMIQSYPEDKLELIIVDDGDDSIEDTLIGVPNVVYIKCEKMSVGAKRNLGISKAMYDIIAFMDDDDVYHNNSILERTARLLKTPSKECVFCTTIPCYDICNYSSFMNAPPITLEMSQRVSEATLMFTKSFWQERPFSDVNMSEGDAFIRGREQRCREISPQNVIVSLVHSNNSSSRKVDIKEPNGCHYGFNEKLYLMVSEIGETLKGKEASK